jgi:hypothetical protein
MTEHVPPQELFAPRHRPAGQHRQHLCHAVGYLRDLGEQYCRAHGYTQHDKLGAVDEQGGGSPATTRRSPALRRGREFHSIHPTPVST